MEIYGLRVGVGGWKKNLQFLIMGEGDIVPGRGEEGQGYGGAYKLPGAKSGWKNPRCPWVSRGWNVGLHRDKVEGDRFRNVE